MSVSGEGKCRLCGQPILWVKLLRAGVSDVSLLKNSPLDQVPQPTGTILRRVGRTSDTWYGRVVPTVDRPNHGRLYVSHFATCSARRR